MPLSYWDIKSNFENIDFTIVGSGIVGLNCALHLKNRFPSAKILILEKGSLPQGASTKNAGFACFGSLSEILSDLKTHTKEEVLQLTKYRVEGLQLLRKTLGDKTINYEELGGYELFFNSQQELYDTCLFEKDRINQLLDPLFKSNVFSIQPNKFHFKNIKPQYLFNQFEGQIDTGKMMTALLEKVKKAGVNIINATEIIEFSEGVNSVKLKTNLLEFSTKKLCIATNGFASQLLNLDVKPARAQVLITKPINDLKIKGTFHLNEGFYYFRNIDNRILFGGGRNLDFKIEETFEFGETSIIQNELNKILKTIILPKASVEIEHRWSGIMGVGTKKHPIVKQISNNVFCAVRIGGMGIAIGSLVGKQLADSVN